MRAAIYARVSKDELNVDNQLIALRDYCRLKNWSIFKEYIDKGISGTVNDRPALNKLMKAVQQGLFDVVLVWRFDRFARSVQHLITALDTFRSRGIDFVSITEQIDTSTAAGKVLFTVLAAFSEFERDLISERIIQGQTRARLEGKIIGRPRAEVNTLILSKLHEQGASIREIAKRLNLKPGVVYHSLKRVQKTQPKVGIAGS